MSVLKKTSEKSAKSKKLSEKQVNARKLRVRFLILVIISGGGAILALHLATPGTSMFIPWGCLSAINILTFLLSGFGFITNLLQWLIEE